MRYVFIVNPVAGKGNCQDGIINSVKKHFKENGGEYKICVTAGPQQALSIARKEAGAGDKTRIFACGGEGTVFEVLNGIIGFENAELGVIPCGSANDFLKFFHTREPFLDISEQINGESLQMDVIKAGDYYCLNGCSVGMDAMVARDMNIFKNWPGVSGKLAYKLAVVKTFLKKLGVKIEISVDGAARRSIRCLFAVIANAPYYGGSYCTAPSAVPFDGKLDLTVVDVVSRLRVPKFLALYERGEHTGLDYCDLKSCKTMEFWSEKAVPVNLDGEIVETCHMCFEIIKHAVKFVIPHKLSPKMLTNV